MKSYFISLIILLSFNSFVTVQAQELNFDSPNLDKAQEKENKNDFSLGSYGGLNFGVLFDERYLVTGKNAPGSLIHVNELNITGNIGDNISILAEQLLTTSKLSGIDDQVGDDHGFVYAIFSNVPLLPAGTSIKIGRFRFKWGIDAVLDAAANPIYPITRKNLGFITDKGIELSGFFGDIDYTLGVADGPDHVEVAVEDANRNSIGVLDKAIQNNSMPLFFRVSSKFSSSKLGLSYFEGKSWAYTNFMSRMPNVAYRTRHAGGMAESVHAIFSSTWSC